MKKSKNFFKFILNGKYDNNCYKKYNIEIKEFNYNAVIFFSICSFVLNLGISILAFLFAPMRPLSYPFMAITLSSLLVYRLVKRGYFINKIELLYYIYITVILICHWIIGVRLNLNSAANAIAGMYVLLPMFFITKPFKYTLYILFITLLMCVDSQMSKDFYFASMDCVNCISFALISAVLSYYTSYREISLIINRSKIEKEKNTDYLTKLSNRSLVEESIKMSLSNDDKLGVMFIIDLDNFKKVNDTYGHTFGDEMLVKFANVLRKNFRKDDLIARIGGDEFTVFVENIPSKSWALDRAKKVIDDLNNKLLIKGKKVLGCSIGIAYADDKINDYFELYKAADEAMYKAKNKGKNCYEVYEG